MEEIYQQKLSECRLVERQLREADKAQSFRKIDVETEVEKTLDILNELHLFLGQIPDHRLREMFTGLKARLTVHFKHNKPANGKRTRENVPVRAVLTFGKDGILPMKNVGPESVLQEVNRGDWI